MIVLTVQPEWHATSAHAVHTWPVAHRDELLGWLAERSEPSLRILASVLDEEIASRKLSAPYSAGAS